MKRKQPPRQEERRRQLADTNLLDEPKRINVRRRGCGPLFGSLLLLASTALGWAALVH